MIICDDYRLLLHWSLLGENSWSPEKELATLFALSKEPEKHYQVIYLRKTDGSKRQILAPDYLLKLVQRQILDKLLIKLPISNFAMAYRQKIGLAQNASLHLGKPLVMRLDIADFFDNITYLQVYTSAFSGWSKRIGTMLANLCCYREHLPQGAPTSPILANLVLNRFDETIGAWCQERAISYSRYCDDLIFSGQFNAKEVLALAQRLLHKQGFHLKAAKTKIMPYYKQQLVTGAIVNEKLQAPKNYRRKLRQEIYYCQKFGVRAHLQTIRDTYFLSLGELAEERYWQHLLGKVNYVLQLNPTDSFFVEAKETILIQLANSAKGV